MLVVLGFVLLNHVRNVLVDKDLHDLVGHLIKVSNSVLGFLALRCVLRVQVCRNLPTESFVLYVHVDDIVDLGEVVQVEEQVRHVHALLRKCLVLLLPVEKSELLHFVQVQVALIVVLEQALEYQITFLRHIIRSSHLLWATGRKRVLILYDLEQAQPLRVLFLNDLIDHAPLRESGHLRLAQVLEEAVCLKIDHTLQAQLLSFENLHPSLDKTLNLQLLLFNDVRLLLKVELAVFIFNTAHNLYRDAVPLRVFLSVGRYREQVDLTTDVRANVH